MSDPVDASNALVAAVSFYAKALGEERAARQQAEHALRNALAQVNATKSEAHQAAYALAYTARAFVDEYRRPGSGLTVEPSARALDAVQDLERAADEYRDAVGRVEPDRAREGAVRAAPAPGDADVPRPDR